MTCARAWCLAVASRSGASFARRPSDMCDDALLKNIDTSLLIRPCACALVFAAYRYPLEFGINLAVLRLRTMYEFIGREHYGVPVSSVTEL